MLCSRAARLREWRRDTAPGSYFRARKRWVALDEIMPRTHPASQDASALCIGGPPLKMNAGGGCASAPTPPTPAVGRACATHPAVVKELGAPPRYRLNSPHSF